MGPLTGLGSIVVDDVQHNIDAIIPSIEDADELKTGMVARVTGSQIASDGSSTATGVSSAAGLRGAVSAVDASQPGRQRPGFYHRSAAGR